MITRTQSLLAILLLWAATYLPALGFSEFHGEEAKRVVPAVSMIDSGQYLVPYLGGQPYLRKPPLVNWLVAASFQLFGTRNEWTARLPSTIFILAVAITLVTAGRMVLGPTGSTIAALCWLTNLGLIDRARTIEIDAIYASLFALALISWLVCWQLYRSPWLTFTVPWIFLGLGLLAKGPALVCFFYVFLLTVLWRTRRLRELLHPAHAVGVLVMLTIFTAWALPYFLEVRSHSSLETWSHEVAVVFRGEEGRSENWWLNLPSGIAYFLPWIFLLLFIRPNKIVDPAQRETAHGLTWGTFVPFVAVLLFPGALPRYVLPLGAPISWLIGMAYAHGAFEWRLAIKNFQIRVPRQLIGSLIAIGIVGEIMIFPLRTVTFLKRHERVKPIAAQINAAALPGEPLYAIGQVSQPYFFYVRAPVIYVSTLDDLPATARNFFIQSRDLEKLEANPRWNVLRPQLVARIPRYRNREAMIFAVKPKKD